MKDWQRSRCYSLLSQRPIAVGNILGERMSHGQENLQDTTGNAGKKRLVSSNEVNTAGKESAQHVSDEASFSYCS